MLNNIPAGGGTDTYTFESVWADLTAYEGQITVDATMTGDTDDTDGADVIDDVWVNIVPCFKVKVGKWISATDRTPFHTDYIKSYLDDNLVKEVRLLKRFMKGINVYGAEIKVGGFSGYLCELLVLNYGSFLNVLSSVSNWKKRTIIDYEGHYKGNNKIKEKFVEPLIIVDPVDKERNVAAAVRKERYNDFVAASRAFLKSPHLNFFYPPETEAAAPAFQAKHSRFHPGKGCRCLRLLSVPFYSEWRW